MRIRTNIGVAKSINKKDITVLIKVISILKSQGSLKPACVLTVTPFITSVVSGVAIVLHLGTNPADSTIKKDGEKIIIKPNININIFLNIIIF
ncbi:MAG: hypothetical protein UR64_C0001G0056 [Candidatus Nomurabacteria bacterium GW2011_GWE1_35_16]|uniref:Uncharacterized protein n=1 Tax=Candidatus Nomurabacteria bacterium GW2011_GWE1_35_16 TaxID=1618761 RepID=A0A0G0EI20_9BACT|nr:MAG: hypothetical protein UR55_C0001G0056 [Candidatus Nomurabacteria bacterium GW2011_GWF1_34_20]KKP63765.1 MAG: hypothetical protein UR57_C0001G0056 [Candidatus Nomurabacteria bacterium GW2011_GWE2_34_25]KKP66977.1 MAG: hypothetical protein UR64_C0001G0056 [Candidatus Nomurabacteria bacterium GW2011_GWE1_35_16]